MSESTLFPPGDKLQKAVKEFSDLLLEKPEKERRHLLQEIELKYDLSPKDCEFLNRHFAKN